MCTVGFGLHQLHLAIDVARVIQRLNETDRLLAIALMENTPTETSRAFRRVPINRIRGALAESELHSSAQGFTPPERASDDGATPISIERGYSGVCDGHFADMLRM